LIESNDKIPRLYISYPVINATEGNGSSGEFTGVVAASLRATTLGNVLQRQLIPQFNSRLGLLDRNRIVLYSSTPSFIGKYVFGPGIDPEILPRLFTKFASKSETRGTGSGLFISKSIIESHRGKIGAENNADDKGATFYFILPINT
jgi:hypothetical protein